ncbi:MAG: hypothetical protein GY850_03745 [bacterium]|nr:hypothetical protein [bacterium]
MRRINKNSSLFDLAPELVKEWHPSSNPGLIPKKMTTGYAKKVWWICSQSHEWRATIKSRITGNGCPLCGKDQYNNSPHEDINTSTAKNIHNHIETTSRTAAAVFEPDAFDDSLGHDFRNSKRYKMKATAVLESPTTGHWFYADVKNFSAGGMCFEVDAFTRPGTKVLVKLDRPLFIADRMEYDSIIKWCKVLEGDNGSSSTHSIGVEFA